jgi:hypothetical protein
MEFLWLKGSAFLLWAGAVVEKGLRNCNPKLTLCNRSNQLLDQNWRNAQNTGWANVCSSRPLARSLISQRSYNGWGLRDDTKWQFSRGHRL